MSATENTDPVDTGMGTSSPMWEILSESLHGVPLPDAINEAVYALCEGRAKVVPVQGNEPISG